MDFRKGLGESFRKGEVDGKKKKLYGSRAYQKFFEDYEEIRVPKESGRGTRIKRIYTGDYYRKDSSDKNWYAMKAVYLLAAVVTVALFVMAAFPGSGANKAWYVTVPQAASVACYFIFFRVLCSYIAAPRNMTISEWKRGCRTLKKILKILAGCVLVTAAGTLGYYLLHGTEFSGKILGYFMAYLLCASVLGIMYILENKVNYQKIRSDAGMGKEA